MLFFQHPLSGSRTPLSVPYSWADHSIQRGLHQPRNRPLEEFREPPPKGPSARGLARLTKYSRVDSEALSEKAQFKWQELELPRRTRNVALVCEHYRISRATLYRWKAQFNPRRTGAGDRLLPGRRHRAAARNRDAGVRRRGSAGVTRCGCPTVSVQRRLNAGTCTTRSHAVPASARSSLRSNVTNAAPRLRHNATR